MKKCGRCKLEKSLENFHKCSTLKGGLHTTCKLCVSHYKKKRAAEMELLGRDVPDLVKCTRCFITKSRLDFGRNLQKINGLCSECKDCRTRLRNKWNSQNKVKVGYAQAKCGARNRNLSFQLTLSDYIELFAHKPCYYCSASPEINRAGSWLDRKDSTKGYELDNLLPCCYSCNILKGASFTVEETKAMIVALVAYRQANGLPASTSRPWLVKLHNKRGAK